MRINMSVLPVMTSVFAVAILTGCSGAPEPEPLCEDVISEIQVSSGAFVQTLAGWGTSHEATAEKLNALSAEVEELDAQVSDPQVLSLLEAHAKAISDIAAMVAATPAAPSFEQAQNLAVLMESYETSKNEIIQICST